MSRPLPQHRSLLRASASPVVVMRCGVPRRWSLLWLLLGLTLASPAWPDTLRCTTYEEKTLQRWHTVCDDGTHAVSRYHQIFDRWETTITESPRHSCTTRMDPHTKQVEVCCRPPAW
jgi:hypothetical protein